MPTTRQGVTVSEADEAEHQRLCNRIWDAHLAVYKNRADGNGGRAYFCAGVRAATDALKAEGSERMDDAKIRHLFTYHQPSDAAVKLMQSSRSTLMALALNLTSLYGESADLTVAIRSLHRASMEINYAIIVADEAKRDENQRKETPF